MNCLNLILLPLFLGYNVVCHGTVFTEFKVIGNCVLDSLTQKHQYELKNQLLQFV